MKKIIGVLLCLVTLLSLAGCSSISKIEKAFEKAEYTWTEKSVSKEAKNDGIDGIYLVNGGTLKLQVGIIIEFSAKDADTAFKNLKEGGYITDSDIKILIEAFNKSPLTNGNCCLITLSSDVTEIFKNA